MGHDHSPHHAHHRAATGNIALAFFSNLGFALVELAGGLWTNSIAILSDAFHDFGDSLSLAVAWRLQKISERRADAAYTYGYKRFALLGALFISAVLLVGSLLIVRACIGRLVEPQEPDAAGMLGLAVFGVAVNGFAAWRLRRGHSLSERAVMLHMMEDLLGWIAVLAVSIVMLFADLPLLDPLLSIAISGWVLWNVCRNLRATFRVLLQRVPAGVDPAEIRREIEALPEVEAVHDLHLWSLDGEHHITTLHAVVSADAACAGRSAVKQAIRAVCSAKGIEHATIEIETPDEYCGLTRCSR